MNADHSPRIKLTCPSCKTVSRVRIEKDDLGVCPSCGEWLVIHGRWNRHVERLGYEPGTDFDESPEWETSLAKRLDVHADTSRPSRGRRWVT
jgi:Zn-finger nucleic acid-binding protein